MIRAKFKERERDLKEVRGANVLAKLIKSEEVEQRRAKALEDYTNDITYCGLWQTPEQVDNVLATMTTKAEQVKALTAQLRFRYSGKSMTTRKCLE